MIKELPTSTLYIELDALLDTRVGVLTNMGEDVLLSVLSDNYYERVIDNFKNIDNNLFKELYKNRDKTVLKNSMITMLGAYLVSFTMTTLEDIKKTPFHFKPKIAINIYPYILNEDEINNIIKAVVSITKGDADVEAIYLSNEELTVSYVKSNYSIMIMYDYGDWLEKQSLNDGFKKHSCPKVELIGPELLKVMPDNTMKKDIDYFRTMETMAKPFIDLTLVPIETFCLVYRHNNLTA